MKTYWLKKTGIHISHYTATHTFVNEIRVSHFHRLEYYAIYISSRSTLQRGETSQVSTSVCLSVTATGVCCAHFKKKRVRNKFRLLIQAWRSYNLFETVKKCKTFGAVLVMSLLDFQSETEQLITLMYSRTHYILVYSVHNCSDKNCTSQRIEVKNSRSKENNSSLYILYQ